MVQTTHRPATRLPDAEESEEEKRLRAQREEQQARDEAEAKTAHLPHQGDPRRPPLTPAEAKGEDEAMVKMNFPVAVTLTLPGFRMVHFPAGIQDVPQSLADDTYLKAHGATRV